MLRLRRVGMPQSQQTVLLAYATLRHPTRHNCTAAATAETRLNAYLQQNKHVHAQSKHEKMYISESWYHAPEQLFPQHCKLHLLPDYELIAHAAAIRKCEAKEVAAGRALKLLELRDGNGRNEHRLEAFYGDLVLESCLLFAVYNTGFRDLNDAAEFKLNIRSNDHLWAFTPHITGAQVHEYSGKRSAGTDVEAALFELCACLLSYLCVCVGNLYFSSFSLFVFLILFSYALWLDTCSSVSAECIHMLSRACRWLQYAKDTFAVYNALDSFGFFSRG